MDRRLRRLLVVSVALVALWGVMLLFGWAIPGYAGGPEATPTCDECKGGMSPTPVPNTSSIVGFVYDYSAGSPAPAEGMGVTLSGCSWDAVWGTDDNGYFYFDNLGQGIAYVNLQLPPDSHAINPNIIVETSGVTQTYTVYLGFYRGGTPPSSDQLTTPEGEPLTPGALIPGVGGTLPDSYLVIGLSATLLLSLPVAGVARLARRRACL